MDVDEGVGCGCGSGHDCGCGWQRDIYLHAPLSAVRCPLLVGTIHKLTWHFYKPKHVYTWASAPSSRRVQSSWVAPLPVSLNQSKLIAQQAGAVKTKATTSCGGWGTLTLATRTLDSYGHGPKSQTFVQHLRLPQWGRSKRTGCPSHPTPNPTQTQPGHKFNYSKSSPNAASKQAKSH